MKTILLIFGLWLAKAEANCPVSCNCTATSVSCVDKNLETIPNLGFLESSPVILDFSGNKLLFISEENFNFPRSDEVKEIYLNNTELGDIGEGTFDNLENLQDLYLGQNYLSASSVPEDLIENLDSMVLLDMSKNYFDQEMPIIRSKSLEVLALVDSKISIIPTNALEFLPNLKLLLLQQNNIQTLNLQLLQSTLFLKLSFNPWSCSCDNVRSFHKLGNARFIDTSEPYQCFNEENNAIDIFNGNNAIIQECMNDLQGLNEDDDEIPNTVNENDLKYLPTLGNYSSEDDFRPVLSGNCWEIFTAAYASNSFLTIVIITTAISFLFGFITGVIFCKIVFTFRYKKLDQSSDSQVQLLRA